MVASQVRRRARWTPVSIAIWGLMLVAAVAYATVSIIHSGIVIAIGPITIDDPFPGAVIPEAVIAIAFGIGSLSLLALWPIRWWVALASSLFAFLFTVLGLTITAGSGRTGDIAYHITVLALSGVIVGLLLLPVGRQSLAG